MEDQIIVNVAAPSVSNVINITVDTQPIANEIAAFNVAINQILDILSQPLTIKHISDNGEAILPDDINNFPDLSYIVEEKNGTIAIDYSSYYARISTAIETIAVNSTEIKNRIISIDESLIKYVADFETYRDDFEFFKNDFNALKIRGDGGEGITTTSPYELGEAVLYHLYVKQAFVLEGGEATPEEQQQSLDKIKSLIRTVDQEIKNLNERD